MLSLIFGRQRGNQAVKANAAGLKLLNLGCGARRHPAWNNADLVPNGNDVVHVDLRRPLPFRNREFHAVYASHVLEHLTPEEGVFLLAEVRRVLRCGGIVRLVVPDLEGIVREYLAAMDAVDSGDEEARWRHRWMTIELLDQLVRTRPGGAMARWWSCRPVPAANFVHKRLGVEAKLAIQTIQSTHATMGAKPLQPEEILRAPEDEDRRILHFLKSGERHKWMYDRLSLNDLLLLSGFSEPSHVTALESRIVDFRSYELDADSTGAVHKPDSLFMEAVALE